MVEEKNRQISNKNSYTDKNGDNLVCSEIDNQSSVTKFSNTNGSKITVIGANIDCNKIANSTIDSRACNKPEKKVSN